MKAQTSCEINGGKAQAEVLYQQSSVPPSPYAGLRQPDKRQSTPRVERSGARCQTCGHFPSRDGIISAMTMPRGWCHDSDALPHQLLRHGGEAPPAMVVVIPFAAPVT